MVCKVKSGRERRGGQLSLGERGGVVSKVWGREEGWSVKSGRKKRDGQ